MTSQTATNSAADHQILLWIQKLRPQHLDECSVGWAEKLKMSKRYYGHKVPVVIHKNKDISLFTF